MAAQGTHEDWHEVEVEVGSRKSTPASSYISPPHSDQEDQDDLSEAEDGHESDNETRSSRYSVASPSRQNRAEDARDVVRGLLVPS